MIIDWQRVCLNLRAGGSLESTARKVGTDGRVLQRLARGETSQPRFDVGIALLDMHLDRCPDKHAKILIKNDRR